MPDNGIVEQMVEHVPWMVDLDYLILEKMWEFEQAADSQGYWTGARALSEMIGRDRSYVSKRLNELARADILKKDGTIYSFSETGTKFMKGEIGAEDVPEPE